ncbi:MAG: hypothetical protein J5907_02085 [Bacteroidales bacterium]|nr:hypothetical protein [Bacteroidales bacterium]
MKKLLILILCLAGVSAWAQGEYISSLEIVGGAGFGKGPKVVITPQYVGQYDFGGFRIGAGVGVRYAQPCYEDVTKNGSQNYEYCGTICIPVFVRLGFDGGKVYANLDAGYSKGIISRKGSEFMGDGGSCYSGVFVDPHVGMRIGGRSAIALGVLLQQGTIGTRVQTDTGESHKTQFSSKKEFTPAINLRYAFSF